MSRMDCAGFEAGLARALAEPRPADGGTIDELRSHAASCPSCRGAAALVDLAASAAVDRDPVPDPGPAYWSGFEERLAARLRTERPARRRLRRAAWIGGLAAAAAAVVAAILLAAPRVKPPEVARAIAPAARPAPPREAPGDGVRSATPRPAPSLDREAAEEDESVDALAWSPISDPFASGDEPGLFPEASGLSEIEQDRFAAWLADETRRVKGGAA